MRFRPITVAKSNRNLSVIKCNNRNLEKSFEIIKISAKFGSPFYICYCFKVKIAKYRGVDRKTAWAGQTPTPGVGVKNP